MIDVKADPASQTKVLWNVQALRAIAATLVVFNHVGSLRNGIEIHYFPRQHPLFNIFSFFGLFGVDIFFVISGFIILTTTANQFAKPGASIRFFLKRCIRIYPPYWLVLIPMTVVYLADPERLTKFHPVHDNLVASYLLLPQLTHPLVAVSWTLVFEMFFYVVFAFLLLFPRRFVAPAMIAWFCAQIALFFAFGNSKNAYLAFLGDPIVIEFIFGVFVGVAYVKRWLPAPRLAFGVGLAACTVLWSISFAVGDPPGIERIFIWGIPAALLVYGAVALEATGRRTSAAWAVSLGDASYAMYLWHLPVMIAIAQFASHLHAKSFAAHLATVVVMLAAIVAFSWAVYRYVERPMTSYLNSLLVRRRAPAALRQDAA